MADTKRTVTIYINGKEVESTYKSIQAEQRKINDQLKGMVFGSDEYNAKIKELSKANKLLADHRQRIKGVKDELGEATSKADGLLGAFSKVGGGLGGLLGIGSIAVATDAVVEFANQAYESFKQSEEAATKVEQKLQSTGNTAGLTMQQLTDAAEGIMKTTTFDDDAILNDVTNTLLSFKNVQGQVFLDAQKAAADYAANSGKSLEEASTSIGQALEDPEKAGRKLRAMNILLTKSEEDKIKKLQESGKLQEAQAVIIDRVNEAYEGQAAALAATDTGKIEQQKNAWGEVEEQFGAIVAKLRGAIAPALIWIADKIGASFTWLMDNVLTPIWNAFSELFDTIRSGVGDTDLLNKVMKVQQVIWGAITFVITTVIGLITSYVRAIKSAISDNALLSKSFAMLKNVVGFVFDLLSNLPALFSALGAGAKVIWNAFSKGDFSKSIKDEMTRAYVEAKKGMTKINKEVDSPLSHIATPSATSSSSAASGGHNRPTRSGKSEAQKRAEKEQAQAEKDLKEHLERVQKLLDGAAEKERNSRLSDIAQKEADIRGKYEKEIEIAKKYGNDNQVIALQKAMDDELYLLRANALEKQQDVLDKSAEERRLSLLSEGEREIETIKNQYAEKIAASVRLEQDLANATEEQRQKAHEQTLALESQRDAEIAAKKEALAKAQAELNAKALEEYNKGLEDITKIEGKSGEALFTTLDQHYADLLKLADKYGYDTTELRKKYLDQQRQIEDQHHLAQLVAYGESFQQLGEAIGSFADDQAKQGVGWVILQRGLALAQIAIDTARAIGSLVAASAANPTNAVTFGAAGAAQYIVGIAQILGNVAAAKKLLSTPIPQAFTGGYRDVTGAQDGKRYRARYLGRQNTGMLPDSPSLVLASERGPEYYVSNRSLRNPRVANLVRMIDNIENRRHTTQMAEGGYTPSGGGEYNSSALYAVLDRLTRVLNSGIVAILPDQTLIEGNKRLSSLNESSGGRIISNS